MVYYSQSKDKIQFIYQRPQLAAEKEETPHFFYEITGY